MQLYFTVSRFLFLTVFAGCLIFVSLSCRHKAEEKATKFCISDSLKSLLKIDSVKVRPYYSEIKLTGKITFDQDHVVRIFPVVGGRVQDVKVSLGDYVKPGQALATLFSADIASTYQQYQSSIADLNIARKNLKQTEELYQGGVASERDYLNSKEELQKASAEANRMEQTIKLMGGTIGQSTYTMTAPIGGFVVEKNITEGMNIRPDFADDAFIISDLKDVWVIANVYETDIPNVRAGMPVAITTIAYPDKVFKGTIELLSSILDPESKVAKARIRLNNPIYELKPDMYATVRLLRMDPNRRLPSIPANAMVFDQGKFFVITYKDDCNVGIVGVEPVSVQDSVQYLQAALPPGTRIISRSQLLIYNALSAQQ